MIGLLRSLRSLVLGETWSIPLGVAAVVALAALLDHAAGSLWNEVGGAGLVLGASAILLISTRRS